MSDARRTALLEVVARLPTGPGVYLFRDAQGAVAYIGKARNLQQRVRSYFGRSRGDARRAVQFVDRYVHAIEFVSTASEPEAFLLENRLVKRHEPAYNVKLRDDKDFLYVRIDRRHDFPYLGLARRPRTRSRQQLTLGPFASAGALRTTLRMLGGVLPLRDCSDREFAGRTRPCLKHDMGRCAAPCTGLIGKQEYGELLDQAIEVLQGRPGRVVEALQRRMQEASEAERYELAARLRDQIRLLRSTTGGQRVENTPLAEGDVLGLHRAGECAQISVLFFRGGTLVSVASHALDSALPDDELVEGFLLDFYAEGRPIPRRLLLPVAPPEREGLRALLAERRGGPVALVLPQRGAARELLALAERNARDGLALTLEQRGQLALQAEALARRLGLPRPPLTIECFDVSHTGRGGSVASRVVFRNGEPDRARYRHYRIRSSELPDDYGALAEVLARRLARAASDPLPDLLLVDGGAGQLAVAARAIAEAGLPELPIAALSKGDRRGRAVTLDPGGQEHVHLPGGGAPLPLDRNTPEEYLLQRLRDEAHRFAITRHRDARSRRSLASRLDEVPGVGPVLKKRLLLAFGGTRGLSQARPEQLASVKGVGPELARAILDVLGRPD